MELHCFASAKKTLLKIRAAVKAANVGGMASEMYATEELYRLLCRPRSAQSVFILCPKNRRELTQLLSMSAMLSGVKVILVLPKPDKNYERAAHAMLPCFLAFADEDFSAVTMVLQKVNTSFSGNVHPHDNKKEGRSYDRPSRAPGH